MGDWQPVEIARPDGTLCAIRLRDALGHYEVPGAHFLGDDGFWYAVNPPAKIAAKVTHWRPLTEAERETAFIMGSF